ncbi:MAG: 16S rRNA processing protein RimM [Anaerolineales bacterium]|nr:16S rRNA processing protein RimM [Chloroflexota bacterium]MBL6982086.1 16S rRNA processing protein RimM [Anaerolineales bacterium]
MNRGQILFSPESKTGSPSHGEPEFLVVGKLRRPHGLRGDVLMSVLTDFPERLVSGIHLYVGDDHQRLKVRNIHWHGKNILIAFDDYDNRESVGVFRNQVVSVHFDDLPPLKDGEMYQHQLLGLKVIQDEDNALLGTVEKIIETGGANDVFLVISENGTELLLPDIKSVVLDISIERKEMRVRLIPGLLPEQ